VLAAIVGAPSAWGQQPLVSILPPSLLPPKDGPESPTVLVLKTWQVVTGPMEPQVGGYMVTVPNGKMLIQYENVRTAATSLRDAYERMSANLTNPTANDRVELAHWCTTVGLWDEAQKEAIGALQLEPQRLEARRMLIRIEAARRSANPAPEAAAPYAASPEPGASTGGLSRESMATFVRQVQPLLFNSCGNAACHGTACKNEFRLDPFSSGQRLNRLASDKNLAEVLEYIREGSLEQNRLLQAVNGDTTAHRRAFTGPRAEDQRALLAGWIRAAARDVSAEGGKPVAGGRLSPAETSGGAIQQASLDIGEGETANSASGWADRRTLDADATTENRRLEAYGTEENASGRLNHVDEAFLKRMLIQEQPDPFDPEVFNRAVHGIEARPRTAGTPSP
jgi:hypothetical protein